MPIFLKKMGKKFMMLKFRSMRINSMSNKTWTTDTDSRKTKFGNFIRKTAIDELPQLFNVLAGERYKMVSKEFKGLIRGEYGQSPIAVDPAFVEKIIGDTPRVSNRPADSIPPELDSIREKMAMYYEKEEDVLSYALFGQVAEKFFEYRKNKKYNIDVDNADAEKHIHTIV